MDNTIRIGIVGSRYAAEFHYAAYQRVTGVKGSLIITTNKFFE